MQYMSCHTSMRAVAHVSADDLDTLKAISEPLMSCQVQLQARNYDAAMVELNKVRQLPNSPWTQGLDSLEKVIKSRQAAENQVKEMSE